MLVPDGREEYKGSHATSVASLLLGREPRFRVRIGHDERGTNGYAVQDERGTWLRRGGYHERAADVLGLRGGGLSAEQAARRARQMNTERRGTSSRETASKHAPGRARGSEIESQIEQLHERWTRYVLATKNPRVTYEDIASAALSSRWAREAALAGCRRLKAATMRADPMTRRCFGLLYRERIVIVASQVPVGGLNSHGFCTAIDFLAVDGDTHRPCVVELKTGYDHCFGSHLSERTHPCLPKDTHKNRADLQAYTGAMLLAHMYGVREFYKAFRICVIRLGETSATLSDVPKRMLNAEYAKQARSLFSPHKLAKSTGNHRHAFITRAGRT